MSGSFGYFGIVTSKRVISEMSDPAIKLFGKTIALSSHSDQAGGGGGVGGGGHEDKGFTNNHEIPTETNDKEQESANSTDKSNVSITTTATTLTADHETHRQKPPQPDDDDQEKDPMTEQEQQQLQQNDAQDEKPALKKPDKILPCPRCNSMDTKFCYYNNYNVNQPRHFCKNCQRYWTAGGTMRNVPVGAGRRKNKNVAAAAAAAHYRHLTMTDSAALQAITPDTIHHPALKPNGTVLSFGSDTPLCESMSSVLSLAEKTMNNCSRSGFQRIKEHTEEQSTGSSAISSNSPDHEGSGANVQEPAGVQNCQGFAPHHPYINGSLPWSYPWNLPPPPPPGAVPFCGSSFPIPIYPATAYWGCNPWSIPWLAPMQDSPSPSSASPGSGSNSPTLGKHTREGNVLHRGSSADGVNKQSNQEKCLWIPKTLRIDDPEEAAKSSIWATMGFSKNDKADDGGLFKSFQTKAELGSHRVEASQALHANPAALSRSINFQESS